MDVFGLWWGYITGMISIAILLVLVITRLDWKLESILAMERAEKTTFSENKEEDLDGDENSNFEIGELEESAQSLVSNNPPESPVQET